MDDEHGHLASCSHFGPVPLPPPFLSLSFNLNDWSDASPLFFCETLCFVSSWRTLLFRHTDSDASFFCSFFVGMESWTRRLLTESFEPPLSWTLSYPKLHWSFYSVWVVDYYLPSPFSISTNLLPGTFWWSRYKKTFVLTIEFIWNGLLFSSHFLIWVQP